MRKKHSIWLTPGILVLCTGSVLASPNYSFETGDFQGWRLQIPHGILEFPPFDRPAGTAVVGSSAVYFDSTSNSMESRSPASGLFFAAIGTSDEAWLVGDLTCEIFAAQSFELEEGEFLSGWASFYNGDYEPQDSAWIRITDLPGERSWIPWIEVSGGSSPDHPNSTPYLTATPWVQWTWQAPANGTYELQLGVTTHGDDRFASYGFFDGIQICTVPEPSACAIACTGFFVLLLVRRSRL